MYPHAEACRSGLVVTMIVVVIVINAPCPSLTFKSGAQKGVPQPLIIAVVVVGIKYLNCTHVCWVLIKI